MNILKGFEENLLTLQSPSCGGFPICESKDSQFESFFFQNSFPGKQKSADMISVALLYLHAVFRLNTQCEEGDG